MALGPILVVIANSLKTDSAIFDSPFSLPNAETFSFAGYERVLTEGDFGLYFRNSFVVTTASVLLVLVLSALAGFGLSEYTSRITPALLLFFAAGVMLPIRLGTVSLLEMMVSWRLVNSLTALILVYTAMSMPLAVVLMAQFMRQTPRELKEAARIDGAGEFRVFGLMIPIVRPGLAAVATITMLPIWNDLWFPLILAPSPQTSTVTLGIQQFVGQYATDWSAVLAALTLGAIPVILLFVIFSRQFVSGLTAGAGK
ncbi:carbohydrate ABC transporter permease [Micromonospora sp. NBC_01412]|uniref:carbohydrate ABC transporter permease n=1 Tax=Micromonospora sp. NBC_01412 TaxID=2903590 RepID=UPI00324DB15F